MLKTREHSSPRGYRHTRNNRAATDEISPKKLVSRRRFYLHFTQQTLNAVFGARPNSHSSVAVVPLSAAAAKKSVSKRVTELP